VKIAEKFSFQAGKIRSDILGFHSPDNFPIFIPEFQLVKVADEIVERIFQPIMMLRYLQACAQANYKELFRLSLLNYKLKPNVMRAIEYDLGVNPNSELMRLAEQINA